jgi:NAD(P)-dependent dehydrogenase (short-subunit alcohol dehydrogenase family)
MDASNTRPSVFITGAAGGIGAATVRKLVEADITVFAGYHTTTAGLPTNSRITPVHIDVTDPESVSQAAKVVGDAVGDAGLAAVVNNAGAIVQGPTELLAPANLRWQLELNTLGPTFVVQHFLPLLRPRPGRIVNVSAPTARIPVPFMGPIGASKAALSSWSTALRGELAPWGIPVVVIEPDATRTAIFANAASQAQADLAQAAPARAALYVTQMEAIAAAAAKQKLREPDVVAAVIVKAVTTAHPKRRYTAGPGAKLFAALSHLPTGMRDALVMRAMGLHRVPAVI